MGGYTECCRDCRVGSIQKVPVSNPFASSPSNRATKINNRAFNGFTADTQYRYHREHVPRTTCILYEEEKPRESPGLACFFVYRFSPLAGASFGKQKIGLVTRIGSGRGCGVYR